MILQLLVAAAVAGLGVDALVPVPPYKDYVKQVAAAAETLQRNVLSMEGNIPLLNDSRRHYAEIVHVINYHGIVGSSCLHLPFYEKYQEYLNTSAPEALNNPEKVVTEVADLIDEVHTKIIEIKDLIEACVQEWHICDQLIQDTVKENMDQYGRQAAILIVAGRAAVELNKKNEKFEEVSKDLNAHQYVCASPEELEIIVYRVSDLYQVLHPLYPPVPQC